MNRKLILIVFFVMVLLIVLVRHIPPRDFSIVILPDTQKYSKFYPYIFSGQTQWIADNRERLNIQFVIHEGDIVDNWDDLIQWQRANESMSILEENNVPYSVIPGNHEHSTYNNQGLTTYYNQFFPVSRFDGKEYWKGSYNDNDNNYQVMNIQGRGFLFLNLDFCPTTDEINWANFILEGYGNDTFVILTTHGYLNSTSGRKVHNCGSTEYIWDNLIKNNHIKMVLSGHVHGTSRRVDINNLGISVYQMLADYQDELYGGNGNLRILTFSPSKKRIYVKTYSVYGGYYLNDINNQFELQYYPNSR